MKRILFVLIAVTLFSCSKSSTSFEGRYMVKNDTISIIKNDKNYFIELKKDNMAKAELEGDKLIFEIPGGEKASVEIMEDNNLYFELTEKEEAGLKLTRLEE